MQIRSAKWAAHIGQQDNAKSECTQYGDATMSIFNSVLSILEKAFGVLFPIMIFFFFVVKQNIIFSLN